VLPGILAVAPAKEIEMVMPGPINVSQVQFSDRLHGVAMGIHAKNTPGSAIVWSDDGGDTWKDAAIRGDVDGAEPESLFLIDRQVGWALMCGLNPRRQILLKSEDGGKSWKQQAAPDLEKAWVLSQIWFDHQGKCGWINTCSGPLLATSDGARSWKPVEVARYENGPFLAEGKPLPPTFEHAGMHVFSLEHVILGGYAGVILQSTDAGRTWKGRQVALEPSSAKQMRASLRAIHFTAGGRAGWAVGGEGDEIRNSNSWAQLRHPVVFSTADGGDTWQRSKVEVRGPLNDVWAISANEAWICGLGGYALQTPAPGCLRHTLDGGKTWINEHPGIDGLRKLFFLDAQHGWVAGGVGGGQTAESVMLLIRP
jgi:photosystem II stability/assembly factor-like uncharacterized protein